MKKRLIMIWVLVFFVLQTSCKLGPDDDENIQRPIIDRLTANPTSLQVSDTTTVTGEARDPQGEDLTYVWTKESGSFVDADLTGPVVHWKAPSTAGNYDVTLRVTNESGKSTSKSITVPVTTTPNPIITIISPAEGAFIASSAGPVTISAAGQNTDSLYIFVQQALKQSTSGPTSSYSWNISDENGSRTITVLARRHYLGNTYQSEASITVSIEGTIHKIK